MKRDQTIHLGYEVGAGKPVAIPLRHMVVTGQTQEAGKTTTLEALIARAGIRALAFITKRGEKSFSAGHRLKPYFQERADWQFVAAILEASLREKLKFERNWIMRASKGAKTLKQVQQNVQREMRTTTNRLSQDVYYVLNEYLEIVVPQIERLPMAQSIELRPGVNVMELGEYSHELQALVIRSCLAWMLERENDTVTILPEAWDFLPQGRGSPVKIDAARLIRQGAGLRDYVWIDSQDIAGVDKEPLRSCPVWLLGVQREDNEIRRTLKSIPMTVKKPKPGDVATLGLGQFYACWGAHAVRTYVQPSWMSDEDAQAIARGEKDVHDVKVPTPEKQRAIPHQTHEHAKGKSAVRIRSDRPGRSRVASGALAGAATHTVAKGTESRVRTGGSSGTATMQDLVKQFLDRGLRAQTAVDEVIAKHHAGEKQVNEREAAALRQRNAQLEEQVKNLIDQIGRMKGPPPTAAPPPQGQASAPIEHLGDVDTLYGYVKSRLLADAPALLRIIAEGPEIEIKVERRVIETDLSSANGMCALLISEGYFDETQSANAAWKELKRRWDYRGASARVYEQLDKLTSMGFVTKEDGGYRAVPNMKSNIKERD